MRNNFQNWDDVLLHLQDIYHDQFTQEQIRVILSKAYSNGHSSGWDEVVNCFHDLTEFAENLLKAKA